MSSGQDRAEVAVVTVQWKPLLFHPLENFIYSNIAIFWQIKPQTLLTPVIKAGFGRRLFYFNAKGLVENPLIPSMGFEY